MRSGSSPKVTGSSGCVVIGFPERVEVEPLVRCLQAVMAQALGVTGGPLGDHLFAVAAFPLHCFSEGFESDAVAALEFYAEQQVDRAFQQSGQEPWTLLERGGLAEEVHSYMASAMQWYAVAGNRQPFAAIQALAQLQHHRRVQFADLDQPQIGRPGFAQQAVEALGVLGVHQHVHGDLFAQLGEGAADFQIAQVRTHQHLPAFAAQLIAQPGRVDDLELLKAQLAVPYVELVQQRVGKGHELAEDLHAGWPQGALSAPVGQALLVVPGTLPGAAAEQEKVQDDTVQHRAEHSTAEDLDAEGGEFHQPETAALLPVGPVFLLVAHARHRRQRMLGKRTSMPKNSRVCMLELSALSWNIRKCERPSRG